jgi:ABC-type glycerol-3-phosphate transport system substrate-binding protein
MLRVGPVALAAAPLFLAACGGAPAQSGPAAASEPTVKLTYLHQWSQTQGHGPITDQLAARFREQFPTIQMEPVYSDKYYEKITAVLAGGDWPDVITYNLAFLPQLIKRNVTVPAETLAKGQYRINLNDMVPAGREMATFDGKLTAMPYVLNNSGLAYNQTLFKQKGLDPSKPPATWNDLVDQAKRLTGTNGETAIWGTVFPKGTADNISPLMAFLWQNGGDAVDMKKLVPTWNSPAGVEALQFQVDLVHKHRVASFDKPGNANAGEVGIWHIPPGNVSQLQKNVGTAFEWGTAVLPKGKQQATTVGGHSLVVLKTNKYQDQAWRFVHWWTQPAQNGEYLVASTTLPPWHVSEQSAAWQKWIRDEPRTKPFVEMLAYGRPSPKLSLWQDVTNLLVTARDEAGAQKKSPQQALDDAARIAEPLIKQG